MSEGSSEREHQVDQGIVPPLTISSDPSSQHPSEFPSDGNNKSTGTISGNQGVRSRLVHSVSIVVEPVLDDNEGEGVGGFEGEGEEHENVSESCDDEREAYTRKGRRKITTGDTEVSPQQRLVRKERIHSSPIIVMDDHFFESKDRGSREDVVRSIIATARLRKEEFAKLLEEHAQLVHEINRVETKLV